VHGRQRAAVARVRIPFDPQGFINVLDPYSSYARTRTMHYFRQNAFGGRATPGLTGGVIVVVAGGSYSAPSDRLAGLKGEGKGKREGWEKGTGEGKAKGGERGEGKGGLPNI